uniref:Dynein heavy chain ATP-binding dynein motor region domain-containing protein n=1 Tax=Oryzias sinensis TaxID=183150 RepID=A0A8C8DR33_9TELE
MWLSESLHANFLTGPRYVVQIGDKVIDYNEDFRLFLATRNPSLFIPPDAASVVTEVNFTTTRAGLKGQVPYWKNLCWR